MTSYRFFILKDCYENKIKNKDNKYCMCHYVFFFIVKYMHVCGLQTGWRPLNTSPLKKIELLFCLFLAPAGGSNPAGKI